MPKPSFPKLLIIVVVILTVAGVGYAGLMVWRNTAESDTKDRESVGEKKPVGKESSIEVPSPGEADTSTWKTYRNLEYGFEVSYPASEWVVLPVGQYNVVVELVPPPYATKPEWSLRSIVVTSIPIQEGQSTEELLIGRLRLNEGYGIKPSMESFTVKEIGDKSFYFTSHGPFEGDYSVGYYAVGKDRVIIFGLRSRTGVSYPDTIDDEPDHLVLKQMLSTFQFLE